MTASADEHDKSYEETSWQGINHLALITDDMDATVRFWHEVLGARVVATIGTDSFRHYFFRVGPGHTVAFFEYDGITLEKYEKPAGVPYAKASQFDHLSLNMPDEESLETLRGRLKAHDCQVTEVVDHQFIRSIYFTDNNGIALEATYWVDPATESSDPANPAFFHDRDPVPALNEIMESGTVSETPSTRLTDSIHEKFSLKGS